MKPKLWFSFFYEFCVPQGDLYTVNPRYNDSAVLGGSFGCAVRLETRRSRVQPPPRSATFFRGDWSWNIFNGHSLPSADSRRAVVRFWQRMCTILVNRLEDQACPVNVWISKMTAVDMSPLGWLGRKTSTQTNTATTFVPKDVAIKMNLLL